MKTGFRGRLDVPHDVAGCIPHREDDGGIVLAQFTEYARDVVGVDPAVEADQIDRLVAADPRMSDLILDGIRLYSTNPAVQLDFGAFGKGYAIDLAIRHLRDLGVKNAIVNAGGDLRAIGSRAGHPWRVAIRRPSGGGVFATIDVQGDESVFPSGDYERNFVF